MDIEQPRGFKFRVRVYINNVQHKDEDYKALIEKAVENGTVAEIIRRNWSLGTTPTIVDFKYQEIRSNVQEQNTVHIAASSNSKNSDSVEGGIELDPMMEVKMTPTGGQKDVVDEGGRTYT